MKTQINTGKTKYRVTQIAVLVAGFCLLVSLTGCEAFRKKFRRKPKEEKREEPIIQPESYPDVALNKDELYRDYFLFGRAGRMSWYLFKG